LTWLQVNRVGKEKTRVLDYFDSSVHSRRVAREDKEKRTQIETDRNCTSSLEYLRVGTILMERKRTAIAIHVFRTRLATKDVAIRSIFSL
jgi:hypothetical protein